MVSILSFGWVNVFDWIQKTAVVEPVEPFQGVELERLSVAPKSTSMDYLGFV
jgi:hypothetical protein